MDEGVDDGVGLAAAGASLLVSLFVSAFAPESLESVEVSPFDSVFLAPLPGDEYRSEYHPPPLRMKLVPALMSRCAVGFPHLGQTSVAGAVMRCISSHSCPQALHPYS